MREKPIVYPSGECVNRCMPEAPVATETGRPVGQEGGDQMAGVVVADLDAEQD